MIGVYALGEMNKLMGEREAAGLAAVAPEAAAYKRNALAAQSAYGWTAEGNIQLPIEDAMRLIVEEKGQAQTETPSP
jgi:hypothetical protein